MMTDPTANAAFIIFSSVSPFLIAFVKQAGWSRQINAFVALLCYIVIGVLGTVVSGEPLVIENAVALIATATVIGSAAYNLFWNNLMVSESGDPSLDARITAATSLIKA